MCVKQTAYAREHEVARCASTIILSIDLDDHGVERGRGTTTSPSVQVVSLLFLVMVGHGSGSTAAAGCWPDAWQSQPHPRRSGSVALVDDDRRRCGRMDTGNAVIFFGDRGLTDAPPAAPVQWRPSSSKSTQRPRTQAPAGGTFTLRALRRLGGSVLLLLLMVTAAAAATAVVVFVLNLYTSRVLIFWSVIYRVDTVVIVVIIAY